MYLKIQKYEIDNNTANILKTFTNMKIHAKLADNKTLW